MRALPVVHTLGGCGGTLLAKCLGCLDGVVLLSECNPNSAELFERSLNPLVQVRDWYPDVFAAVASDLDASDMARDQTFSEFLLKVVSAVEAIGGRLVVRDYNYIDFFGVPFTHAPDRRSSLRRALAGTLALNAVVLVRHPLDQYTSLRSHSILEDVLSPDVFLSGYAAFLNEVGTTDLLQYERLVESPRAVLRELCTRFGLTYADTALNRFSDHQHVTGNRSRDADTTISLVTRATPADTWTLALQERAEYRVLVAKLGYTSGTVAGGRERMS